MNRMNLISKILTGIGLMFVMTLAHAGAPVWTILPLTATTITVPSNSTATVSYQITNQSKRTHTLAMNTIPGITQVTTGGNCSNQFVLGYQQSCILTLSINGSALSGNVTGGPVICNQGNPIQCYQPSQANELQITLAEQVISVTPSGDGHETISPSTPQTVNYGATQQFTVTANTGYALSQTVGGTCPVGSWTGSTYTTGAITSSCSVSFSATINHLHCYTQRRWARNY